jgi:mersacidin/lichenicidin family type 2 lantibiotic
MSFQNIIRAWKDESFRASLSDAERAQLPANPAGTIDLTAVEMEAVEGGMMKQKAGETTQKTAECTKCCW